MTAKHSPGQLKLRCAQILLTGLGLFIGHLCAGCRPPDEEARSAAEPASSQVVNKAITAEIPEKKWRILHIMSYHSPWFWTDDQFNGFKEGLSDVEIEYRVFQMDTKRRSTDEWKQEAGRQARALIDSWAPDLVYTSDDNAAEYVVRHYLNSNTPFVFSGVNDRPEKYGFVGSSNVTGVLEQEHSVATVRLLKQIAPKVKTVAVFLDDDPTWPGVKERILSKKEEFGDVEFVGWHVVRTFAEYKELVKGYQTTVDALGPFGTYTYKDDDGQNVPYDEVLRWTAENSKLPDLCFWSGHVDRGLLCAVTVSPYEQGRAAGLIARRILVDKESPGSIPMEPTVRGRPVINLARANKLGLKIEASILLGAQAVTEFPWSE